MTLPDDLYDYAEDHPRRRRRPRDLDDRSGISTIVVTDHWPEGIPVSDAEVDIVGRIEKLTP